MIIISKKRILFDLYHRIALVDYLKVSEYSVNSAYIITNQKSDLIWWKVDSMFAPPNLEFQWLFGLEIIQDDKKKYCIAVTIRTWRYFIRRLYFSNINEPLDRHRTLLHWITFTPPRWIYDAYKHR